MNDVEVPVVSALVVSWNSASVLPGLLESLGYGSDSRVELIQVDNASSDDSVALGAHWSGAITQLENRANRGFATALKQAVAAAHGEFLLVVNPDVRFEDAALSTLLDAIDSEDGVGAVGPKLVRPSGEVELVCARRMPNLAATFVQALGLHRLVAGTRADPYGYSSDSYAVERDVECLSGAAMLVRGAALEQTGGVDDRWFMYFEDVDICERLRQRGWRLRFCPRAVATHAGAASSPRSPALDVWLSVHLAAAANLFFVVHRTRPAALAHRAMTGFGGLVRIAAGGALYVRSPAQGRRWIALGQALVTWSLTSRHPRGAPAGVVGAPT
jgi:GT2 family glycosyltransferase